MPNYMTELSPDNNSHVYQIKDKEATPITLLKDTVGWIGKNLDNPFKIDKNTSTDYTKTDKGYSVFTSASVAYGKVFLWYSDLPKNTDLTLTVNADYTSGTGKVVVDGTNDTLANRTFIKGTNTFTADTEVELTFNTGSYKYILVTLQVTDTTSASGNILYDEYMLCDASIIDDTYEPYHKSVKQTLRDAEVIEGKNLLDVDIPSGNDGNLAYTVNKDKSVTVSGSHTSAVVLPLTISSKNNLYEKNIYKGCKLTGCKGGSSSTYGLYIGYSNNGTTWASEGYQYNDEYTIRSDYEYVKFGIWFAANTSLASSVTFYPMLRYANETDPTFEPYYIPLKDSKFDRAEQRVLGAKNRLEIPQSVVTTTHNNVTFTVYRDSNGNVEKINVNGTSPNDNYGQLLLSKYAWGNTNPLLPKERVRFSLKGATSGLHFCIGKGNSYVSNSDASNSVVLNGDDFSWVYIRLDSGKSANVDIYPMIVEASDPDDTYVPYAMTNRELTDAFSVNEASSNFTLAQDVEFLNADNHYEANIGNIKYITAKVKGITANANTWTTVGTLSGSLKPISNKVLSGMCQKNASAETCDCIIENNTLKIRRNGNAITATDIYSIMFIYV